MVKAPIRNRVGNGKEAQGKSRCCSGPALDAGISETFIALFHLHSLWSRSVLAQRRPLRPLTQCHTRSERSRSVSLQSFCCFCYITSLSQSRVYSPDIRACLSCTRLVELHCVCGLQMADSPCLCRRVVEPLWFGRRVSWVSCVGARIR